MSTYMDDPHHSLLHKPVPKIDPRTNFDQRPNTTGDDLKINNKPGMPQNPPIVKDSVHWWGRSKKK